MRRVVLKEFDQFGEDLSGHCARFAYSLMNLCVKAEEVSLLPVEVLVEGELQKLEECASLAKKDEYSFMVVPKFEEDMPAICMGITHEHPEFKQDFDTFTITSVDEAGAPVEQEIRYLLLKMPVVDNDRYKVLKDGVEALYQDCKVEMEMVSKKYEAKFAALTVGESEADLNRLKIAIDKTTDQWESHRDNLYKEKLQEIEDAHNMWMADRVEETLDHMEEQEAHNEEAGFSMRMNFEDFN
jgi:hypothetical protein